MTSQLNTQPVAHLAAPQRIKSKKANVVLNNSMETPQTELYRGYQFDPSS